MITRRSAVKGAAWSVPAVMVATAAPAYATSEPPVAECVPTFYRIPGNKGKKGKPKLHQYVVEFVNCSPKKKPVLVKVYDEHSHKFVVALTKDFRKFVAYMQDSRVKKNVFVLFSDGSHKTYNGVEFPVR